MVLDEVTILRLIESNIRAVDPPAAGYSLIRDDDIPGFALRVTAAGVRSFTLSYTNSDGRDRRLTIGKWPIWTATAARERARELKRKIDGGEDPLEERSRRRAAPTFADLLAEYEHVQVPKMRRGAAVMARLRRDVLPCWKNTKLEDIRRRDIIALVERKAESAPVSANRTLQHVKAIFNFGVKRDWIEASPAALIDLPTREKPRDRVLTFDELATVWQALECADSKLVPVMRDILKFMILTAARSGEVCKARWADVDFSDQVWTIPSETAKNGRPHRVPLTGMAVEVLTMRQRRRGEDLIFPSRYRRSGAPTTSAGVSNAVQLNECFGLPHWTPHDLRRSVTSNLASLGVAPHTLSRLLNHSESGVTSVHYNTYTYDREKRVALELWERKLRSVIYSERADVLEFSR